jgi:hypothetical protein
MACLQQMRLGASIWSLERETGELPVRNSLPGPVLTRRVKTGCAVIFPQGGSHILQNSRGVQIKIGSFFAPSFDLDSYGFFEEIRSPPETAQWTG